jgi:hypothetical protein
LVVVHDTRRSSSALFVKLPWRKAMEEAVGTSFLNKCCYPHSSELGVEFLHLAYLGGEREGEWDDMCGRHGRWWGKYRGYK